MILEKNTIVVLIMLIMCFTPPTPLQVNFFRCHSLMLEKYVCCANTVFLPLPPPFVWNKNETFMMRKYVYCAQHNKNNVILTVNVNSFNTYKLYKYSKSIKMGVRLIYGFLRSFRYRKKIEITKLHLPIKIYITLYFQWHWDDICHWRIKTPKRPPTVTRSVVRWVAARADYIEYAAFCSIFEFDTIIL